MIAMKRPRLLLPLLGGLALLAGASAGLSGCAMPSRGNPQNTFTGSESSDEIEEVFGDARLRRQFELVDVRTQRRDDRLFVQFELRNKTNTYLAVEWALEWRDAQGFKIESPEHWRPLQVGGRDSKTITATGPVPEASVFQLGVRKPSPVD